MKSGTLWRLGFPLATAITMTACTDVTGPAPGICGYAHPIDGTGLEVPVLCPTVTGQALPEHPGVAQATPTTGGPPSPIDTLPIWLQ